MGIHLGFFDPRNTLSSHLEMLIFTAVELQIRLNRYSQDYQPPLVPPF